MLSNANSYLICHQNNSATQWLTHLILYRAVGDPANDNCKAFSSLKPSEFWQNSSWILFIGARHLFPKRCGMTQILLSFSKWYFRKVSMSYLGSWLYYHQAHLSILHGIESRHMWAGWQFNLPGIWYHSHWLPGWHCKYCWQVLLNVDAYIIIQDQFSLSLIGLSKQTHTW